MKIYQNDRIVLFTLGVMAVTPIFRRYAARRQNKFEIFAVGDFGGIKCGAKKIRQQKKYPAAT